MAYLRYGSKLYYVDGTSNNYIYYSSGDPDYIEDYNEPISDAGLAEMVCDIINSNPDYDDIEKIYFMEKLCERLGVKLKNSVKVAMKI